MIEIEHCIFLAMPVDVPCVNRSDHSMASSTKSLLPNVFLVGNYFTSLMKNVTLGLRYSYNLILWISQEMRNCSVVSECCPFKAKGDELLDLIFYFWSPRNSSWWVSKCLKYFGKNSDLPGEDVRMLGHCAIRRDRNKNLANTYQSSFLAVIFFFCEKHQL